MSLQRKPGQLAGIRKYIPELEVVVSKCLLCGRKITDPKSVESGYGPVCYKKKFDVHKTARKKREKKTVMDIPCYDIPGQMSIEEYLGTVSRQ